MKGGTTKGGTAEGQRRTWEDGAGAQDCAAMNGAKVGMKGGGAGMKPGGGRGKWGGSRGGGGVTEGTA